MDKSVVLLFDFFGVNEWIPGLHANYYSELNVKFLPKLIGKKIILWKVLQNSCKKFIFRWIYGCSIFAK